MSKSMNCADVLDRMQRGVAWGMVVCGLTYFVVAAEKVFEENPINNYLDFMSGLGAFLTMLVTLIAMYPIVKLKLQGKLTGANEPESFFGLSMLKSIARSFYINMFILVMLLSLGNKFDEMNLEPSFFLILLFGTLVFFVGVNFLYLTRNDGLEDDFDEGDLNE